MLTAGYAWISTWVVPDGGAPSYTITAPSSSATYTANFTTQYYLTTAASPPAGGTITPASGWYNSGAVVAVAANAYGGYVFSGFTGDLSGTTTPQNLTMNAPKSVTANFKQYYLTTAASPSAGGTISPASSWRNSGSVVSVSATANSGYQFTGFSGALSGTTTPQNLTMNAPKTVTANFKRYYLNTAASPPAGGTISPASGWRNSGVVVAVSATTNSGYVFSGFTGALTGTTTPQNLTMNAPKSVTANFTVSNQPPTAVSVTPSSGSGLGPQAFQFLYSDPNGYADLASLYGRFNASASDVSACSFRYDRASNYIYLYNDAGTAWLGPVILGNQLTNSQCTLGAGSTTPSGNNLTLNLTITFTTAFAGAKNVYMQAVDAASASSGWQTLGGAGRCRRATSRPRPSR